MRDAFLLFLKYQTSMGFRISASCIESELAGPQRKQFAQENANKGGNMELLQKIDDYNALLRRKEEIAEMTAQNNKDIEAARRSLLISEAMKS